MNKSQVDHNVLVVSYYFSPLHTDERLEPHIIKILEREGFSFRGSGMNLMENHKNYCKRDLSFDIPTYEEEKECELCGGLGYYGDNNKGIRGNSEYVRCECGVVNLDYLEKVLDYKDKYIKELEEEVKPWKAQSKICTERSIYF